jgi:hypothetical protein
MGSVLVFSLFTVQFSWSLTVALMIGPERRRRKHYWSVLLLSFIPLSAVYGFCMVVYVFLGAEAAVACFLFSLAVLGFEMITGILYGNELRARLQR